MRSHTKPLIAVSFLSVFSVAAAGAQELKPFKPDYTLTEKGISGLPGVGSDKKPDDNAPKVTKELQFDSKRGHFVDKKTYTTEINEGVSVFRTEENGNNNNLNRKDDSGDSFGLKIELD